MQPNVYKERMLKLESRDMDAVNKRLTPEIVRLIHAGFGLVTETGEIVDQLKKHIFYGANLDKVNIKEELGDVMWYTNIILDVFGWSLEEVMQVNHDKLVKRYGDKFSEDRANVRDLDAEREILENGGGS